MKYNRILITGGAGFIPSNFFQYLTTLEEQPLIRLFDRRYGQDLTRWEDVDRAWSNFEPDAIINFASNTHIDTSIKDPRRFYENNLGLVVNVLEACRKYDTRLIQISSSEVYGTNKYVPKLVATNIKDKDKLRKIMDIKNVDAPPMDEWHPLCPHSPYAWTKVCQDRAVYSWWQTYELDASVVRPFNQYGPYQQLEKMIPKTITRIMKGEHIPVYGEGLARRDWVFVQDTVRGIWMALEKLPPGDVVNLATGVNYSVIELVDNIKQVMGELGYEDKSKTVTVDHVDDRLGHVYNLLGDASKAENLLGWTPEHTLQQGLRKTAEWVLNTDWGLVSR